MTGVVNLLIRHGFLLRTLLLLAPLLAAGAEEAPYADAAFQPPWTGKGLTAAERHPLPQADVEYYLEQLTTVTEYEYFKGYQPPPVEEKAGGEPLQIGENLPIDLGPEDIFLDWLPDGDRHVFLGALRSLDAEGMRLEADVSALAPEDELWVIDPEEPRAFGPYGPDDEGAETKWLASMSGDMAVLMVRSESAELPLVYLHTLAHFHQPPPQPKALDCNINIACETRDGVLNAAAAVGVVLTTSSSGPIAASGALINNPDIDDPAPLFITAAHAIADDSETRDAEIVWDYRAESCGEDDAPDFSSLPRSAGKELLATDGDLDISLVLLDDVPSGEYGRTYLGWDTRSAEMDEPVITIHHPDRSHMRISYGHVTNPKEDAGSLGFKNQIRVLWEEGLTEGGSSGSPLLADDGAFRLLGVLSNGARHSCRGSDNWDRYASFGEFYPNVKDYVTGTLPDDIGGDDGSDANGPGCPAEFSLRDNPEALEQLRRLRDEGLLKSSLGRKAVDRYYEWAPSATVVLHVFPRAQTLFRVGAAPFVWLGGLL
ncbi:MAG: trypsin-like serine peptidase [Candidatus Hydrogenedentota bacterium]